MQKTKEPLYLPISDEALKWLPERGTAKDGDSIFPLTHEGTVNDTLQHWAKVTGITKHISFHVARHTHATMMLTLGADLYAVSKLLGHKNIATTQIYAKIVDKKKEEAIGLLQICQTNSNEKRAYSDSHVSLFHPFLYLRFKRLKLHKMDGMELKPQFDRIQEIFDRCINHAYRVLKERISEKTAYLDPEQVRVLEQQEYCHTVDELAELYLRYSVLSDLRFWYSEPSFFWESGFFEALSSGEKKKYLVFSTLLFEYSRYERDNIAYDEELPYFSAVVKAVVWERYAAYLRERETLNPELIRESTAVPIALPHIAETDNPFDSMLTDEQIAFLAEGINDVKMFNVPLSADDLTAIFAGKPHAIVRSNNNRLVAFFFAGLSDRGLITQKWQSVIANHKLFLSKDKTRDMYINQSDLSTATNYIRDIGAEGKYSTLEKYLKQVKKL